MRAALILGVLLTAAPTWAAPLGDGLVAVAQKPSSKQPRAGKPRAGKPRAGKPSRKKPKKAAAQKAPAQKSSGPITVPLNIGFGPALHLITGPVQDDQRFHFGIKLYMKAILDAALIQANLHRVPKKYRGYAKGIEELRIGHLLIPDTLFLSPRVNNTAMYGVSWRPIGLDLPLSRRPVRLAIGIGLDLSYAYLDSQIGEVETTTHFLRPGADLTASLEIPFSPTFLIDVGWTSLFYPPQAVGGDIFALGDLDESIWHIGQAFLRLHFRVPYQFSL